MHTRRMLPGLLAATITLLSALPCRAQSVPAADLAPGAAVDLGTVSAGDMSGPPAGASAAPTPEEVLRSGDTVRVLDTTQMGAAGPVAGAAQALALAPGANVTGYGNTGSSKFTVSLDGATNGWAGAGGYGGNALLQVTLDGVPMNNPSTGLYPSAALPQLGMFQSTTVTYGGGLAVNRWTNSGGGTVEFTPIQPTTLSGGDITGSYGSFDQRNLVFDIRSGTIDGWSSVIAGGVGGGNDFRTGPDGFANPGHNEALYAKTTKSFDGGDVAFGTYYGEGDAYRPNVIPLSPNPSITINGYDAAGHVIPGPLYSEKAGYYQSLPQAQWSKYDKDIWWDVYTRQNVQLGNVGVLHNLLWFSDEVRLHDKIYSYQQDSPNALERLDPTNHTTGDKLWVTVPLPYQTVEAGGYYMRSFYNTKADFWNPQPPFNGSQYAPNGPYRSGNFTQDNLALFVQDDISPVDTLHITPALRLVQFNVSYSNQAMGPGAQFAGATGTDQSQFGGGANSYHALEPSLAANWAVRPWLALYANYTQVYQTPLVGGGGGLYQAVPATGTQLEQAREAQAGFKTHFVAPVSWIDRIDTGANVFDLRFSKQVITATLFGGAEEIALGTSEMRGINFYGDADMAGGVHGFVNGAVETTQYTSYTSGGIDFSGRRVPYVPASTLNIGISRAIPLNRVTVTPAAWYQFIGQQAYYNDAAVIGPNGPVGAPSRSSIAGYQTVNLSLDAKFPVTAEGRDMTIDASVSVLNVLGARYNFFEYGSAGGYFGNGSPVVLGYQGAPRSIYGQVGIMF